MKDKTIFLDSGIIISLGLVHNAVMKELYGRQKGMQTSGENVTYMKGKGKDFFEFSNDGLNEITRIVCGNKDKIRDMLESESVNILDQDVENLCDLYLKIINKEINALAVPTVYKEICLDATNDDAKYTKAFFNYCGLALPKNDYLTFAQQTVAMAKKFVEINIPNENGGDGYGLGVDSRKKIEDENATDVNLEDRWLVSQVEIMSKLGRDNLQIVPGNSVDTAFVMKGENYVSMEDIVKDICGGVSCVSSDAELQDDSTLDLLPNSDKKFMLLHENEKDFGREIIGKRVRTLKVKNQKNNRNAEAMDEISKSLNKILTSCETVTPDGKIMTMFLSNDKKYDLSLQELIDLKKEEEMKAKEENESQPEPGE